MQTVVGIVRYIKLQTQDCQYYPFFFPTVDHSFFAGESVIPGQLVPTPSSFKMLEPQTG